MGKYKSLILLAVAICSLGSVPFVMADSVKGEKATSMQDSSTKKKKNTDKMMKVLLKTTLGDITIALYDETPKHKENFIKLVNEKYYDGVLFHRVIQNFMIQTGDPDSKNAKPGQALGSGGPGYTIPAEFVSTLYHKRGAVAAARMGDNVNPTKASSGSQFYIVDGRTFDTDMMNRIISGTGKYFSVEQLNTYEKIGGAPHLDGDYTVFGEVIDGMDVVDKVAAVAKDFRDRPKEDIRIISAEVIK